MLLNCVCVLLITFFVSFFVYHCDLFQFFQELQLSFNTRTQELHKRCHAYLQGKHREGTTYLLMIMIFQEKNNKKHPPTCEKFRKLFKSIYANVNCVNNRYCMKTCQIPVPNLRQFSIMISPIPVITLTGFTYLSSKTPEPIAHM